MSEGPDLTSSSYEGWHIYQQAMVSAPYEVSDQYFGLVQGTREWLIVPDSGTTA